MTADAQAASGLRLSRAIDGRRRSRLSGIEVAILAVVVTGLICAALLPSLVSRQPEVGSTAVMRVAEHDTLWEIARAHPVEGMSTVQNVALIEDLNEMSGSAIAAGQILRVPSTNRSETALASR